jgi:membrane fusion protein (multidrug efflux system)
VATHGRLKRYLIVVAGLLAVIAVLGGIKGAQIGKLMAMGKQMQVSGPPPEAVGTAPAQSETWETGVAAIGSISSQRSVAVSNEVPGTVSKIRFESGQIVRQGQILVELDAQVERAQLASATARRELAARNAERARKLAAGNAVTRAQVDDIEAQLKTAITDTAALRAQMERKVIRAPFPGRVGIRAVNVGQYLTPGTTVTTIDAVGGTFVDFSLPQEELATITVGLPVRITMEEGSKEALTGTISAIEPTIDPATRHVKIRAAVPELTANLSRNPRTGSEPPAMGSLGQSPSSPDANARPGMFVTVQVIKPSHATVVAVPATAIVHASFGDSVFVVEDKKPGSPGMDQTPDGKPVKIARQQFVRTGAARGDFVAITKGVSAGQQVVSAGAFKLRNNAPVVVNNTVQAKPQLAPTPENR